jgi:broad specificity phosphatase PhoE
MTGPADRDYHFVMAKPLDRMRRRPLLAPLLLPLLVLLAAGASIFWLGNWARTTVVVLVRHAEPQPAEGDPDLSIAGERRVAALGTFLADVFVAGKVDHLYAGDTRRAQQTAAPVANQFGLPINLLAGSDWPALARRIKADHRGETVVVVGYANTLPMVLKRLTGTRVEVGEEEFDSVFVVVLPSPGQPRVLRLHYGAPATTPAAPAAS